MLKRASYEKHLVPQIKFRVTEMHILTQEKLQSIHAKTKERLFKGANTKLNVDLQFVNTVPETLKKDFLHQTYLTSNCQIDMHRENLNHTIEECKSCQAAKMVNCQYCDSNLCFSCCVECEFCQQMYCKNCTASEYIGNRERMKCYKCSLS